MTVPEEGWLARNIDMNASVVIDTETLSKPDAKPGAFAREMAKGVAELSALVLIVWLGALLERFGQHPGALIWVALGGFIFASGFGLYAWGARSATRRATKGEDTER